MSEDQHRPRVTEAQAEARRRNAQRSTGPRTEAGKRRSSRNAVRHGLYAKTDPVVDAGVFAEDPEEYRDLVRDLVVEFDPHTTVFEELVEQLASVLWRMRRVRGLEALALAGNSYIDTEADQRRGEVTELLLVAAYLHGEAPGEDTQAGRSAAHRWLAPPDDTGSLEGDAKPSPEEVERLAMERWGSMADAGDGAMAEAEQLAEELQTVQRDWLGPSVHSLLADDTLHRLSRPEAHLARQRDHILGQLRALQKARAEAEDRDPQ